MTRLMCLLLIACGPGPDPIETSSPTSTEGDTTTETTETTDDTDPVIPEVHLVTPDDLNGLLQGTEDFLLINVHIPYAGEIKGTDLHVPYNDETALLDAIGAELDRKVVVYCRTGPMSDTAANFLVDEGYTNVWDMPGGMVGWEAAGYDLLP